MASRQRMETGAKNASVSAIVDNFFLLNAFIGFSLRNWL
jgi:hypothetical protein